VLGFCERVGSRRRTEEGLETLLGRRGVLALEPDQLRCNFKGYREKTEVFFSKRAC